MLRQTHLPGGPRASVPDLQPGWLGALTANVIESDRQRCLDAGMDDCLAKPVKIDALDTVLRRAVDARAAA